MLYLFLATGFEELEAIAALDVIRRAQLEITTISVTGQLDVTGAHGINVKADALFDGTDFSRAEMLILPGGMPGTLNLENYTPLIALLKDHNRHGGRIAAICAAPSILGKIHLLRNQQAVCYPGFEEQLIGAFVGKEPVATSSNITTSRGPGFAIQFGLSIVRQLKGDEVADQVAKDMLIA